MLPALSAGPPGRVLISELQRGVVDEVLHSGEVGVALGRDAELINVPAFTLQTAFGSRFVTRLRVLPLGCFQQAISFHSIHSARLPAQGVVLPEPLTHTAPAAAHGAEV